MEEKGWKSLHFTFSDLIEIHTSTARERERERGLLKWEGKVNFYSLLTRTPSNLWIFSVFDIFPCGSPE